MSGIIKWTFEKCKTEALKYKNRKEFSIKSGGAYNRARVSNWLDDICSHMTYTIKNEIFWTEELCRKEALKYQNLNAFRKLSSGAFNVSVKKGWLKEITKNYNLKCSKYKRFIYSYEFSDNYIYVGLTCNIKDRQNKHNKIGSVFQHIKETNLIPVFKLLTDLPVDVEKAIELEEYYLKSYINNGYFKLNRISTGGLGSGFRKWDEDSCKKEASKYKSRKDFKIGSKGAYEYARKHNILNIVCKHIEIKRIPKSYWTLEKCLNNAKNFSSVKELQTESATMYKVICENNWNALIKNILKNVHT